ncbi:hypothetical protein L9F63_021414, partial [Diploptera punctata]
RGREKGPSLLFGSQLSRITRRIAMRLICIRAPPPPPALPRASCPYPRVCSTLLVYLLLPEDNVLGTLIEHVDYVVLSGVETITERFFILPVAVFVGVSYFGTVTTCRLGSTAMFRHVSKTLAVVLPGFRVNFTHPVFLLVYSSFLEFGLSIIASSVGPLALCVYHLLWAIPESSVGVIIIVFFCAGFGAVVALVTIFLAAWTKVSIFGACCLGLFVIVSLFRSLSQVSALVLVSVSLKWPLDADSGVDILQTSVHVDDRLRPDGVGLSFDELAATFLSIVSLTKFDIYFNQNIIAILNHLIPALLHFYGLSFNLSTGDGESVTIGSTLYVVTAVFLLPAKKSALAHSFIKMVRPISLVHSIVCHLQEHKLTELFINFKELAQKDDDFSTCYKVRLLFATYDPISPSMVILSALSLLEVKQRPHALPLTYQDTITCSNNLRPLNDTIKSMSIWSIHARIENAYPVGDKWNHTVSIKKEYVL